MTESKEPKKNHKIAINIAINIYNPIFLGTIAYFRRHRGLYEVPSGKNIDKLKEDFSTVP